MHTIRRLMTFAKKYWYWIILTSVCMLSYTGFDLLFPQTLRLIIDRCLRGHQYDLLPYYAKILLAITVARGVFEFGQLYLPELVS